GLTMLQPDMGNAVVLIVLTLALAYLGGARPAHMGLIAGAALPLAAVAIAMKPYRLRRVAAFLNPWNDPQTSGFQIIQSFLALGVTIMLATQTLVDLGVVTRLLPTKGLPLPFISFGGSALTMTLFSTGILLNISQHTGTA